ncbi:MAG: phosphoglycerate kinase [Actinomycetota bacterium]|nr:phosphoglycerate kinase [Actinomycetota bacterium]
MFSKKMIGDVDVSGKRVLVRVDFNVPLADGTVTDDTRVRAALPTIEYLVDGGAKVILMSHLGRPKGEGFEEKFSLAPAARVLGRLLPERKVTLVDGIVGDEVGAVIDEMADGDIVVLENLRFDSREKKNDPEFAQQLASLADIYVNDAFGTAHRAHASTAGVAAYLPAYSGFLLAREVEVLTGMLAEPARPFVAVLGGSKVSDKIGVIDRLLDIADSVIIGGGMCFTFLKSLGYEVGTSLLEEDWVDKAGEMLEKAKAKGARLLLPVDVVAADRFAEDADTRIVSCDEIPSDMMGLDIGPDSAALFREAISGAKTIFWNGPMGVFEMDAFADGTKQVALAIADNQAASSVVGGGDSVSAVKKFALEDKMTFISTGGGASMELVEGKKLPGVEALLDA